MDAANFNYSKEYSNDASENDTALYYSFISVMFTDRTKLFHTSNNINVLYENPKQTPMLFQL